MRAADEINMAEIRDTGLLSILYLNRARAAVLTKKTGIIKTRFMISMTAGDNSRRKTKIGYSTLDIIDLKAEVISLEVAPWC